MYSPKIIQIMKTIAHSEPRVGAEDNDEYVTSFDAALAPPAAPPDDARRLFLLAEDSENDAFLTERAFKVAGIETPFRTVPDGEAALDYLRGTGGYGNRLEHPLPDVMLLDLDLPRKSGFEVLSWMQEQSLLESITVVILTASNREADAERAHELGAKFYLTKPGTFEELVDLTRCLHDWLQRHQALEHA